MVRSAATDLVETHIEYLRVGEEWDYRRVVPQACARDERDACCDETDLDALLQDLAEPVRAEAADCGVHLRLELAQELAHIRLDRVELRNVLLEMVHEALLGLALGQVEARELVARIGLTSARQIEICVNLLR